MVLFHVIAYQHLQNHKTTWNEMHTNHHFCKLLVISVQGAQLNIPSFSSLSNNLPVYKHSSGLTPHGARVPQHEQHHRLTPCLSFPYHQSLECAECAYLPNHWCKLTTTYKMNKLNECKYLMEVPEVFEPVINCIARRTLVLGVTVISLFCKHHMVWILIANIHASRCMHE